MYRSDSVEADLLQCFFVGCEQRFRFLEEMHGYQYISGLAEYKDNYKVIRPYSNQKVDENFLALTRYERGDQAIEILFGDGHFVLEGYVYFDPVRRFEFSEILLAAKKNDRDVSGEWRATDERIVSRTLDMLSEGLQQYIHYFTNPNEKLLRRAETIRHKRIEQAVRKHFESQIAETCVYAAKAFLNKDYVRVVSLLQPLEMYLGRSDLKKLKLARRYILA